MRVRALDGVPFDEFDDARVGIFFYVVFVVGWCAFARAVVVAARELSRALTGKLLREVARCAATLFPVWCALATVNARRMLRGKRLGVARVARGEADPLTRPNGANGRAGRRRCCVVGGGASGLVAARRARETFEYVRAYERSDCVGGVWAYGHRSGGVFNSVLQNVTKLANAFADYPCDRGGPLYFGWRKTLEYLRGYADHFGLLRDGTLELNAEVTSVRKDARTGEFVVDVARRGADGSTTKTRERFDYVWVCSGQLSVPSLPDVRGIRTFPGRVLHSSEYKTPTPFEGKDVLVVGLGSASGSDLAQELAVVASSVTLSVRTERYIVKRGLSNGVASVFNRVSLMMPAWLGVVAYAYFDCYPFVRNLRPGVTDSGELLNAFALQKIHQATVVDRVRDDVVHFVDGTSNRFDVIVFATGYERRVDFMADDLRPTEGLFEDCVLPSEPRVGYILFVLPFGTHWQVAEAQAMYLSRVHSGDIPLPSTREMRERAEPCPRHGSHTHFAEHYRVKYLFLLAPYIFPEYRELLRRPQTLLRILWSPYVAPFGEWASADWARRTTFGDARGHTRARWRGRSYNVW